VCIMF